MNPSHLLRAGPSGPSFEPSTPGYVLTIQADGKNVAPEPLVPSAINVERIDSGNGGGARLVDVDTALLLEGCLVSVASVGALFWLAKNAPASLRSLVDGITIVQSAIDADDIWVRLKGPPNPIFAGTPPLFVDPTLGDDDNNGQASGASALKSLDEWSRRMDGQMLRNAFTVSCAAGDVGNFGPCRLGENNQTTNNIFVNVVGSVSLSAEVGTVSSVTAQNSATGQEFIFQDSSGVGPVIPDNCRLQIVSSSNPANVGGTAYVKGFGAGGPTNPYTTAWTSIAGLPFFPAPGDTYAVSTLNTVIRSVQSEWLNPSSELPSAGGVAWSNVILRGERFAQYQITSNELVGNANFSSYFIQCAFDDAVNTNFTRCNFRSYGCEFRSPIGVSFGSHNFHGPCFRQGLAVAAEGFCTLDAGPAYFDGAASGLNISGFGNVSNSADICFSRLGSPAPGVLLQGGAFINVTGQLWTPPLGARNALRFGVMVFATARLVTNFFSLLSGMIGSVFRVTSEATQELTQFTDLESIGASVTETSLGNGSISLQNDLLAATHLGFVPATSPTLGSQRYTIGNGQFARSAGGALSTVVPASSLPSKTHAQLHSLQVASPTVQTVGAATAFLVQCNLANPGISGPIDGVTVYCEAVFVGYDGTEGVSVKVSRTFKRVAGVLTALGTLHVISPIDGDAALLGVTVDLNVTGTSVQAQATGVAGATINWNAYLELRSTEFVG